MKIGYLVLICTNVLRINVDSLHVAAALASELQPSLHGRSLSPLYGEQLLSVAFLPAYEVLEGKLHLFCHLSAPVPQVPGISRTEASALYQGGFLNAKNLVSAPPDKLATALRINVPFRIRSEAENKGVVTRPYVVQHGVRFVPQRSDVFYV